jgi:hypothetical protein
MEPDSDLICGHSDAGTFGLTIRKEPLDHCKGEKFAQHPKRTPEGDLMPEDRARVVEALRPRVSGDEKEDLVSKDTGDGILIR